MRKISPVTFSTNLFSSRLMMLFGLVVAVFAVLLTRAFDLQVVQGKSLWLESENNRLFTKRVVADRGLIRDRFGQPLVRNKPVYYLKDKSQTLFSPQKIITPEEAMNWLATDSARVVSDFYRDYPLAAAAAHLLGYVGAVSEEELASHPDWNIYSQAGKSGIERQFEDQLRGIDGEKMYEINSRGQIIREINNVPSQVGQSISLSIDGELQTMVDEQLGDNQATAIVMDAQTGQILAMASHPTYNPNRFTWPVYDDTAQASRSAEIAAYFSDPKQRFFNRNLTGTYPPGSIFKLVTAMAALESSAIDDSTIVDDQGTLKVGDFEYGNWYYRQYGRVEGAIGLVRAITRSNDIFFYKAAEWVGPDKLALMARLFGFGSATGIELSGEAVGIVPDPAWKERTIGERWFLGNTYHYGIGQGDLLVTPLQMTEMLTVFANRGRRCRPTVMLEAAGRCEELSLNAKNLDLVREGMQGACSTGGTAFPFFNWNSTREEKVLCKTGTAEFGAADTQGHRQTHGWFAMTVEFPRAKISEETTEQENHTSEHQPYPNRLVIVVLTESDETHPFREGSRDAAPIALEILKWLDEKRL